MKVFIDAASDIHYSSFYIKGLYTVYGKDKVCFSSKYFADFTHNNHFFSFVIEDKHVIKKIVIDFTDSSIIDPTALEWCDVYGKINLDIAGFKNYKVVAIGPSFGIRLYSLYGTLKMALVNLLKAYNRIPDKRKFLSDYKAQLNRPRFEDYVFLPSSGSVVFFMASLWKQEPTTNIYRGNFITSCKQYSAIDFEGGFAPRTNKDISGFEHLTTEGRVSIADYLKKITSSILVFNTPAVKGCHGWKLAEYLCLGKAIISTPLSRDLPAPLVDETHVLLTDGTVDDITKKLNVLIIDSEKRWQLERNARDFFSTYLAPEKVIDRLLS